MNLAKYISDLLFRYDCVIVPDFGGFVTNRINASLQKESNIFYPPTKQITFNSLLNHNDGLLANYIANSENISYDKASTAISLSVIKWKNELQKNTVELENIGKLSINDNKNYVFEPNTSQNFLTSSFGLSSVASTLVSKSTEKVVPIIPINSNPKKTIPSFIKYAATAAILLTLGFAGYKGYEQNKQQQVTAKQQEVLEKKIQTATFVISNPLPILELNVSKEKSKPFHIIAGAFQFPENAEKKKNQLLKRGFEATIIGKNKWGLTEVTYNSYSNRKDAINSLNRIKRTVSKEAWLKIKKLD